MGKQDSRKGVPRKGKGNSLKKFSAVVAGTENILSPVFIWGVQITDAGCAIPQVMGTRVDELPFGVWKETLSFRVLLTTPRAPWQFPSFAFEASTHQLHPRLRADCGVFQITRQEKRVSRVPDN